MARLDCASRTTGPAYTGYSAPHHVYHQPLGGLSHEASIPAEKHGPRTGRLAGDVTTARRVPTRSRQSVPPSLSLVK
jgi:hypothetical protein